MTGTKKWRKKLNRGAVFLGILLAAAIAFMIVGKVIEKNSDKSAAASVSEYYASFKPKSGEEKPEERVYLSYYVKMIDLTTRSVNAYGWEKDKYDKKEVDLEQPDINDYFEQKLQDGKWVTVYAKYSYTPPEYYGEYYGGDY